MIKIFVTVIIALLIGAIATKSFDSSVPDMAANDSLIERLNNLEMRLEEEIENRIRLEQSLENERATRIAIEDQLNELALARNDVTQGAIGIVENPPNISTLNRSNFGLPDAEKQLTALIDAGFNEAQAERVIELETKMYQDLINTRFSGAPFRARELLSEGQKAIRQELGDDQYELYLETNGRPTRVPIAAIAEDSAGAQAGLKVGDEIVNYDGERIFSLFDLQESTQEGTAGQTVIVDVLRDGSTVSLAIPRGQIGISTGRAGFGFSRRGGR